MIRLSMSRSKNRARGVELVCFDAMFTLFKPVGGDRERLIANVYRQVGGLRLAVSDETLRRQIVRARAKHRDLRHDREYWQTVNCEVFTTLRDHMLRRGSLIERALEVNRRIMTDVRLYEPDLEIVRVVRKLRRAGVRVVIASNQESRSLDILLEHFGLTELFDAVHTSQSLGTRKPFKSFWQKLLRLEDRRPGGTVHVGNSLNADIGAARLKVRTLIWDPCGRSARILGGLGRNKYVHPDLTDEQFQTLIKGGYVSLVSTAREAERKIFGR